MACLTAALAPLDALGYIDPGTGSIILQGIIGALAAVVATGGVYWGRIKAFVARRRQQAPPARTDAVDDADEG